MTSHKNEQIRFYAKQFVDKSQARTAPIELRRMVEFNMKSLPESAHPHYEYYVLCIMGIFSNGLQRVSLNLYAHTDLFV